jgi:hypothetical protein
LQNDKLKKLPAFLQTEFRVLQSPELIADDRLHNNGP